MLEARWELLAVIVDVILVISEDNPADQPSRGKPVETVRVTRMREAVAAIDRGEMTASAPWKPADWKGDETLRLQIRHEMYDPEDQPPPEAESHSDSD